MSASHYPEMKKTYSETPRSMPLSLHQDTAIPSFLWP